MPRAQMGFLNRNWGRGRCDACCLHQLTGSRLAGRVGLAFSEVANAGRVFPHWAAEWGGERSSLCSCLFGDLETPVDPAGHLGVGPGLMSSYLAFVKLIHSLCDPGAVIHPHHPGKPGDEASISWGGRGQGAATPGPLHHPPVPGGLGSLFRLLSSPSWKLLATACGPRWSWAGRHHQPGGSWTPEREGPVGSPPHLLSPSSCLGPSDLGVSLSHPRPRHTPEMALR